MHGIGQFAMVEYSTLSSISKKVRKQERKRERKLDGMNMIMTMTIEREGTCESWRIFFFKCRLDFLLLLYFFFFFFLFCEPMF